MVSDAEHREPPRLFSYGTLQQPDVQMTLFGRLVHGETDMLSGFAIHEVAIEDPAVVAASGKTVHPTLMRDATAREPIVGMVFDLTVADLAAVDAYESRHYRRIMAKLASGKIAFVYVDGASAD